MRILHFNPIDNLAGASRSMTTLMQAISEEEPTYAMVFYDNELAQICRESGAEVRTFYGKKSPPKGRLRRMWNATYCLSKAIRDWKIDLLHIHSATGVRYAWLAAKLHRIPIVCHQRDNYSNDYFHKGIEWSDRIIAISEWVKEGLPENLHDRTDVIYNAVNLPDDSLCKQEPKDLPLQIGFAGRCLHEKGIDLLLSAIEQLGNRDDFELVLWGIPDATDCQNPYAVEIRKQIQAMPPQLRSRVKTEPFRKDINNFYREVDIVVVPSRFAEPMGRMAIEAMAWKRPTIVANHGGLCELVDHGRTGLVFKPGSATDLSVQISTLLDNPLLRKQLSEAGRSETIERFSPKMHLEKIHSVYQAIIN